VFYFSDDAKDALYRRFFASLRPGGILFVGSTERVFQGREIGFETPWPFYYQKPKTQREQTWRRAS
jgi:chemotaxis protein methyltransferase CheR